MSETTFTAGPWRIGENRDAVVSDTQPRYRRERPMLFAGETVEEAKASEVQYYGGYLIAESICPEDATLIAAAPDLYAGLKALYELVRERQLAAPLDSEGVVDVTRLASADRTLSAAYRLLARVERGVPA